MFLLFLRFIGEKTLQITRLFRSAADVTKTSSLIGA